jgi:hypothetical protein
MMEVSKLPDPREGPCLPCHPCLTAAVLDESFPLSAAVSDTPMELTDRDRESFRLWDGECPTNYDWICLVSARGWLLIGGDQVVVALRVSAATATINRTVAGAMALSRTRRWDAIAPRK